ncbi:MAG: hypothetical protein DVB31_04930 [Verrucomicrobia bacterium]|nr:MAG: hypothetical protein DVB31_04930 [Verrucomicrobiota bacterium]
MKKSSLGLFLVCGAALAGPNAPHVRPQLDDYVGDVAGSVVVSFDALGNESIDSDVAEVSNVMHKARQIFTAVDVTQLPFQTSGTITSVRRNGDRLYLSYALYAVAQTGPNSIDFVGSYRIVGGTGKFEFATPTADGDFGSGVITGGATLDLSVPGKIGLQFHDHFEGTIVDPKAD